jgi:YHS domain-containing protein
MTASHLERPDRAQRSATVLDPVCRMEIPPEQAVGSAKLEGRRRFYFCSLPCYEAFLDLPHAYVGWAERHSNQAGTP